jgi:hypothetical protein
MYPEQDARIKTLPVLAAIGICPLAAIRNCPETASPITECDCVRSYCRSGSASFGADVGFEADQAVGHPDLGILRAGEPSGEGDSWSRHGRAGNDILALPWHPAPALPG